MLLSKLSHIYTLLPPAVQVMNIKLIANCTGEMLVLLQEYKMKSPLPIYPTVTVKNCSIKVNRKRDALKETKLTNIFNSNGLKSKVNFNGFKDEDRFS